MLHAEDLVGVQTAAVRSVYDLPDRRLRRPARSCRFSASARHHALLYLAERERRGATGHSDALIEPSARYNSDLHDTNDTNPSSRDTRTIQRGPTMRWAAHGNDKKTRPTGKASIG